MKAYILGLGAAAMICSIVVSLGLKTTMEPLLKLICGLVLTFAAIQPLLDISSGNLEQFSLTEPEAAAAAVDMGREISEEALRKRISEDICTYILDKADGLKLQIEVRLSREAPPVPQKIIIKGPVSPYDKARLSRMLRRDLGISKERQIWTD